MTTLKQRFIKAVKNAELGHITEPGIIVTQKEFKLYFSDIKSQYVTSFYPLQPLNRGNSV